MNTRSQPKEPRAIVLFGIPFHDVSMDETLAWIDHLIAERRAAYLVTANLDFAAQASGDVELQRILVEAELVLCDGTPLVWASKIAGTPLKERVAGSDLVPKLAARAEKKGYKIFLLGGQPEVLERAAKNLQAAHPRLPPVQYYSPPFAALHELDNATILQRLEEAKPDILLVAFGCPKQEKWIFMHYRKLGIPCCIGVGATVDFLAGNVSRAPAIVAKLGLEWVYRMLQEPRRLAGRYWNDIKFLFRQILKERSAARRPAESAPGAPAAVSDAGFEVIRWQGALNGPRIGQFPAPSMKSPFIIDVTGVTGIDHDGLGLMTRVIRNAWLADTGGCFLAPSPGVKAILEAAKLDRILPVEQTAEDAARRATQEAAAAHMRPPVTVAGNVLLFQLPPRVTAENAESCATSVRKVLQLRRKVREIVLDLVDTSFIDSSGLGFLLNIRRLAGEKGVNLRLLHLHDNVLNVIKIAKVEKVLLPQ